MSDAVWSVIGAAITGVLMYAGVIYQSRKSNDALYAQLNKQSEISDVKIVAELDKVKTTTEMQIKNLTDEVRRHNGFAERIPVIEAEQKRLNERIKVLEGKGG